MNLSSDLAMAAQHAFRSASSTLSKLTTKHNLSKLAGKGGSPPGSGIISEQ
jgi:hypothetical protein